ncbi:MAG: imidazole glycerol phosphate synthase subunit HisH [Archangium sp.]|nr:imidazole glycerol phosphate synthase subunit HisH [Archangium sp.]
MRATLFDTGAGNLHSLRRALAVSGIDSVVEADARKLPGSSLVVLPGVGAFGAAATRLAPGREALKSALLDGQPCLGICLGMQLLFERSEEGEGEGLGLIEGDVTRLVARRVPHMGWTKVDGVGDMYFAHSFACRPRDPGVVQAWARHEGAEVAAIVTRARTIGVQFHPEKSSAGGLRLLRQLIDRVTS